MCSVKNQKIYKAYQYIIVYRVYIDDDRKNNNNNNNNNAQKVFLKLPLSLDVAEQKSCIQDDTRFRLFVHVAR